MNKLGARINPLNVAKKVWSKANFVCVFAFMFIIYLIMLPAIRIGSIMNILAHTAVVGTIALGMGLIIISGEIDLSVGSTFAFSGGLGILGYNAILKSLLASGTATRSAHTIAMIASFFIIVGLAALIGFINGIMIGKVKMPAFIATLGTMLIFRSLCKFILKAIPTSDGQQQQTYQISGYYDSPFYNLGNGKLWEIPIVGIILIVLTIAIWYFATYSKFGRKIFALGSNAKASSLAGINVPWTKAIIFTIAGALVGIAAFLHVSIYSSMDSSTAGLSYELYAIASCVIGGIAMTGGRGNVIGILFGALSFQIIDKIIAVANLNPLINDTIKGAILLLAVVLQIIVVDKAAVVKWLQHVGLMYNVDKAQNLDAQFRKKVDAITLSYNKKFEKILTNDKITKEQANEIINGILDEKDAKLAALTAKYDLSIDNAKVKTRDFLRTKAIKEDRKAAKEELRILKSELKTQYNETKRNNPGLVRTLLEKQLELSIVYIDKEVELENRNYALTSNVDVLRENASHLLDRDNNLGIAGADERFAKTTSTIDALVSKTNSDHEATITKLEALKESITTKINATIEANTVNESAQAVKNEELLAQLKAKEDAKAAKIAEKEAKVQAKLDKVKAKEAEAKFREDYLESIIKERDMH